MEPMAVTILTKFNLYNTRAKTVLTAPTRLME